MERGDGEKERMMVKAIPQGWLFAVSLGWCRSHFCPGALIRDVGLQMQASEAWLGLGGLEVLSLPGKV